MKPNIIFFGTPGLTVTLLDELERSGLTPAVVVTGEDKPVGRKQTITPPPPKVWAEARGIPVWQPAKLDDEFVDRVAAGAFDLGIVVAYGKILPRKLLDTPRLGMLNVHYSLLPRYRGATPVEGAILAGETETGVSIQKIVFELDAGPVVAEERASIGDTETAPELRTRLNEVAKGLLVRAARDVLSGTATYREQDHAAATFTKKTKKENGLIDLADDPGVNYRKYRAYFGWPGTYFMKDGARVIIKSAEFVNGEFRILRVVPEGKSEIDYRNL